MGLSVALSNLRAALAEVRQFITLTESARDSETDETAKAQQAMAIVFFEGIESKLLAAMSELQTEDK